jgi:hypothetical protein
VVYGKALASNKPHNQLRHGCSTAHRLSSTQPDQSSGLQLKFSCKPRNWPHNLVSKKQKLLQKLLKVPSPRDFSWDELIVLMEHHGFKACPPSGGGSHYTFQHVSGFCFGVSKTHPSGLLKTYQVKDAIDALERVGVTGK